MTLQIIFGACVFLFISACTTVSVTPINADGTKKEGKMVDGIPFYRPKPYLLVAEMDEACQAKFDIKINNENITLKKMEDPQPNEGETPLEKSLSNTSFEFEGNENGFFAKLIYLPDYSHGYALSINSWWRIFGIAEVSPTLQDGWMLVNLNEKTDSQTSETLNSIASIVAAARSGTAPTLPTETSDYTNWYQSTLNPEKKVEGTQNIVINSQSQDCSLLNFKLYDLSLDPLSQTPNAVNLNPLPPLTKGD